MNRSKRILKNSLARVSAIAPKLVLAIAGTLIGAAAGQAVGPVLVGSVTSSVRLTVEQAITVDTDYDI
jgi:hypothetical protein